ncbi:hypothetical protein L1987_67023 [Smallanthus sonchifolius]|uniref:Uncharacterized protein n=1 Tax=Smallanthus sonchifolius TaxID=185202 RepID=A0ACB9BZ70_9ASTR|nr:hypothetical protein L1987_67023 [Smallanthus sonchifolius]
MKTGVTTREPAFRVTRARAAAASQSSSSEPLKEQGSGRVLRKRSKRSVQDENKTNGTATGGAQNKRRAVLKDVTNICRDNSYKNCIIPAKIPKKNSMVSKKNPVKIQQVSVNTQLMKCDETERAHIQSAKMEDKKTVSQLQSLPNKGKSKVHEKLTMSSHPDFVDIDYGEKDPQMCSVYACEIYSNSRVAEVSVEYKLDPDTLHRTVYLIDMFLSKNYIERQKLQLLGITCMLIASKYEETIAPSVEEFCFITDSTYTKSEVLQMESQVLNNLSFHLSAPTAQTFLRRFIRAAQASFQSPSLELECLASYLAELTLIDYNFLVFLPSNIAAAAVFLARWMLDQSCHPWVVFFNFSIRNAKMDRLNPTLEHYTNYKPLDIKNTVLALHGLHLSDSSSPLTVIRSKYKQDKFNSVASLPSRQLPETLF